MIGPSERSDAKSSEIVQRQIIAVHSIAQTGPELRVILQNGAEPRSIENAIALIENGKLFEDVGSECSATAPSMGAPR